MYWFVIYTYKQPYIETEMSGDERTCSRATRAHDITTSPKRHTAMDTKMPVMHIVTQIDLVCPVVGMLL